LRTGTPRKFVTVPLDVTNEVQAKAAFEAAIASFGDLDVLVNNTGDDVLHHRLGR
jgi:NAD(P)-dependent dehydrogenase (short-subunit alcohol dehydrogenase family)